MIVVEGVMTTTTNRSKTFRALEILKYAIIGINIECMDQIVKHVVCIRIGTRLNSTIADALMTTE